MGNGKRTQLKARRADELTFVVVIFLLRFCVGHCLYLSTCTGWIIGVNVYICRKVFCNIISVDNVFVRTRSKHLAFSRLPKASSQSV